MGGNASLTPRPQPMADSRGRRSSHSVCQFKETIASYAGPPVLARCVLHTKIVLVLKVACLPKLLSRSTGLATIWGADVPRCRGNSYGIERILQRRHLYGEVGGQTGFVSLHAHLLNSRLVLVYSSCRVWRIPRRGVFVKHGASAPQPDLDFSTRLPLVSSPALPQQHSFDRITWHSVS